MKYHPLADIFPLIEGSDYDALVADIKANGLLEPIWIYEDKILDGRNRWKACKDAKIEPKTREYKGKDALGFIVSLNLKRRHLNESQRGMVGARLANLENGGDRRSEQCANLRSEKISQPKAAELLNVSRRSVQSAKQVIERGTPELVKAVDSGRMPVSKAAEIAKAPPEKQKAAIIQHEKEQSKEERMPHRTEATGFEEWYTPPEILSIARKVMGGIDCDPASSIEANKGVKAEVFFSVKDNGLKQKWHGRTWINPPFCQPEVTQFSKAVVQKFHDKEISEACVLVNNATETDWAQTLMQSASAVCFPKGRVRFVDVNGIQRPGSPIQGHMIFYFGENTQDFTDHFSKIGKVWQ
jgi:ParB-like chromosome segregation protein Spo0J